MLELLEICGLARVGFAEGERAIVERFLHHYQRFLHRLSDAGLRDGRLPFSAGLVAPGQHDRVVRYVLRADLDAQRHAAHFPIVELETGARAFALVGLGANAGGE